jgi:integrase/recombinase XerD
MSSRDLHAILNDYLATREALGLKDRWRRKLLEEFLERVAAEESKGPITAQLAVDWACATSRPDALASQSFRLSVVRGFLTHLRTIIPETERPPDRLLKTPHRSAPSLFSHADILRLLDCAAALKPKDSIRPHTYRTIIGLLANAGLRANEAIRLRVSDVQLDLDPPRLHIFETKFRKSRLVPVHSTTAQVLRAYSERRSNCRLQLSDSFFITRSGKPVPYYTLKNLFARLVKDLGIVHGSDQRKPSLHSLRHTFAVQRLTTWYQEGRNVRDLAPHLSVYLGHARLSASYWYLSALPDLLNEAAKRFCTYTQKGGEHE